MFTQLRRSTFLAVLPLITLGSVVFFAPTATAATTLENLQAAFNGESNAHARYLAFAKKADADGYLQVARLFRAAAHAESIHAANHAKVIKSMGGTPAAKIEAPVIQSTPENIATAIKGETYEKDVMYPGFLAQARKEANADAVRTFNFAMSAEVEHAALYTRALAEKEAWRAVGSQLYVCPVCGSTRTTLDIVKCPVCRTPKEKWVAIS